MRHGLAGSIALAGLALPAQAQEGFDLAIRAKSLVSAPVTAVAPPAARLSLPPPDILSAPPTSDVLAREVVDQRKPRAACDVTSSDLCFDMRDRRTVYRGAREYMPAVDGLTPESVSLKRDGIVLKYSFR